jgi:hypothetical protein
MKKALLLTCILFLSVGPLAVAQNLVGHWTFDGNLLDSSGHNNNGTISGTVGYAPGKFGQALSFNGNGHVTIPNSSSLQTQHFTVAYWALGTGGFSNSPTIADKRNQTQSESAWQVTIVAGNALQTCVWQASFAPCLYSPPLSPSPVTNWTHIAVTYDGSTLIEYANGIAVLTQSAPGNFPGNGNADITLGAPGPGLGGAAYNGLLDDLQIYDGALTAAQVYQLANPPDFGNVNVCPTGQSTPAPCNRTSTFYYAFATSKTFGPTKVLTQGAPNLDFTLGSGNTCTGTLPAGHVCSVNVTFAPLAPGLRMGAVQLFDNSGNLLASTLVQGIGQGPAIAFGPGVQTMVPASGLTNPYLVAVDAAGDVFISDPTNVQVIKVTPSGIQTTVPASGLASPYGVAVDGAGDVFIGDNGQVVEVTPSGVQTTVPVSGLGCPYGLAVDGAGDLFIADACNTQVVEVTPSGVQTTVPASGLSQPQGVAVDAGGNVFIADYGLGQVVKVTPSGVQTTVPVSGLADPYGVAVDAAGNVFISDPNNNQVVELTPSGVQTTVGSVAYPYGVAVDGTGDVFIVDSFNTDVVKVQRSQPPSLSFASTQVGSTSADSPRSVTIQNIGNQPLNAITPGLVVTGPNFSQVAGSGTPPDCNSSFALTPGESCNLSLSFAPQNSGLLTSTAVFKDNTLNTSPSAAQSITLQGTGIHLTAQAITFTTNPPGSAPYNSNFTVAATGGGSGNPVVFSSAGACGNSAGNYTMNSGTGTCTVIANQAGNSNYLAAPTVTLNVTATPAGQAINFTSNPPPIAQFGTMFTVAATGGASGNPVTFGSSGACTNNLGTYTMTSGTGTCMVIADQAGNNNYAAAMEVTSMVGATPAPQVITFTTNPPTSAQFGTMFSVAATGGASGNSVTFTSSGGCSNNGGTYTMTSGTTACSVMADQAGNGNYAAATAVPISVTATLAPDAVTFITNPPSSAQYGTNFMVAATGGGSSSPVSFTSSGACGNSGANYSMTSGTGACSVTANQAADNNYSAAQPVTLSVMATLAPQTITFTMNAPPTAGYNTMFTVAASGGASGNPVMFSSSGSCSNSMGTYTITSGTGTCSVIANQAANSNYSAALPVTETTNDTRIGQTINFPAITNQNGPGQITLNAMASSGLPISYSVLSGPATVNNNILTTTASGSVTVQASQAGNENYTAANPVQQTFTVSPNAGQLNGSNCNGEFTGVYQGNLTVTTGQVCIFSNGGITGNLKLNGGNVVLENNSSANGNLQMTAGSLTVSNSTVGKDLQISGASSFTIGPAANIGGNLQIQNVPSGAGTNQVCGASIGGNLQFQNNGTAAQIGSRTGCAGNNVSGNLQVQNNTASTTVDGNTVSGNLQDQNNSAATEVFTNVVSHNLQCQQNTGGITGGGDTAGGNKQGQCSTY